MLHFMKTLSVLWFSMGRLPSNPGIWNLKSIVRVENPDVGTLLAFNEFNNLSLTLK